MKRVDTQAEGAKPMFTPGPWKVDPYSIRVLARCTTGGEFPICDIRGWGYLTGAGHGALNMPHNDAIAIQSANARLIASAPAMHAALNRQHENIQRWLETGEPASAEESKSIADQIAAALALANAEPKA